MPFFKNILPFFYCLVGFGQIQVDSAFVEKKYQQILKYRTAGEYKTAENLCDSILAIQDVDRNLSWKTQIQHAKTRVLIDLGNYDEAIQLAKNVGDQYLAMDKVLSRAAMDNIIGVGFYFKSQLDSTLFYYDRSYSVKKSLEKDPYQLAIGAYNIGIVYEDQAQYNKAIDSYLVALDYLLEVKETNTFLADVYVALANTYKNKNDLVKAEEYTSLALQEGLSNYGPDNPSLSFIYESNAAVYQALGKLEKARITTLKALNLRKKFYGNIHRWTAQSYLDLADIYWRQNRNDSAFVYAARAEQTALWLNNNLDLAQAMVLMAKTGNAANPNTSLNYLSQARKLFEGVYGRRHTSVADTYLQQAIIAKKTNQISLAKDAIDSVYSVSQYQKGALGSCIAPFEVLEALGIELEISSDPKTIINIISKEIELINYIRRLYNTPNSQLFFNSTIEDLIKCAVARCYEYADLDDGVFVRTAFELLQLSANNVLIKERDFMNSLLEDKVGQDARTLAELQRAWAKTNQDLYYEERETSVNTERIDSLLEKRVTLSRAIEIAWKRVENTSPEFEDPFNSISIANLNKKLHFRQQVVQYFIGHDYVYAFSVSENRFAFRRLGKSSRILHQVQRLREAIINRDSFSEPARFLYDYLIHPLIERDTEELVLITQNELNFIPFSTLLDSSDSYLIEKMAISYVESFSLFTTSESPMNTNLNWQGFAIFNEQNKQLPKSLEEVIGLSEITKGDVFLNEQVTKAALLDALENSRIVHLATHGEVNQTNALYSSLDLYEDRFTASELYARPVQSSLVVLSACETAYGNLERGEGVINFARALTISGAQSSLTTLWQVPDKETATIMELFYGNLAADLNRTQALRKAQLSYLAQVDVPELRHPYFWAAFVLSGNPSKLKIEASEPWSFWLGGGLTLVAIGIFYWRIRST